MKTLSEVFYEAACLTGDALDIHDAAHFSCNAVDCAATGGREAYSLARDFYDRLMREEEGWSLHHSSVRRAANEVGWSTQEFRTFMLLMASEAVRDK